MTDRLRLGLWETTVVAGVDREFDGRYRNPLSLLLFTNQYGLGADGNVLFGFDGRYRIGKGTTIEAQVGLDDLQYENTSGEDRYPNRWAFTVAAFGPVGSRLSWRAFYTQASSLAFRTINPFENFTDDGVGLGRNFADMDRVTVTVSLPVAERWLFMPELTLQRQGEGEINDPFPATPEEAGPAAAALHRHRGAYLARGGGCERTAGTARLARLRGSASRGERRARSRRYRRPLRGPAAGDAGPEPPGSDSMTHPPPLTRDRLLQLIERMKSSRVVVIGDIMIDRYLYRRHRAALARGAGAGGDRPRAQREARRRGQRRGERRLDGRELPAGRHGGRRRRRRGDPAGAGVARLDGRHVVTVAGRPTTSKTRIIARSQQIVRIDDEVDALLDGPDLERLIALGRATRWPMPTHFSWRTTTRARSPPRSSPR